MYVEGVWLADGDLLPKDPEHALQLFAKAADKNYGPAMYEIGRRRMDGRGVATDPEAGIKLIHEAAVLGSAAAQFYLGSRYERGDGIPADRDRARRYFRLCAAAREAACQFQIGANAIDASGPPRARLHSGDRLAPACLRSRFFTGPRFPQQGESTPDRRAGRVGRQAARSAHSKVRPCCKRRDCRLSPVQRRKPARRSRPNRLSAFTPCLSADQSSDGQPLEHQPCGNLHRA
jgi:Sel1 repeat-containing protein